VQAPGEAEAMCAALDRAGHVHACATSDGDALLFGARTQFHTMKPVVPPLCFSFLHALPP
jgi:flap endonuclease GEN